MSTKRSVVAVMDAAKERLCTDGSVEQRPEFVELCIAVSDVIALIRAANRAVQAEQGFPRLLALGELKVAVDRCAGAA